MTRPADAKKTVGTLASFGAAGVAAAAAVGYFNAPAGAPSAGAQAAASAAVAVRILFIQVTPGVVHKPPATAVDATPGRGSDLPDPSCAAAGTICARGAAQMPWNADRPAS